MKTSELIEILNSLMKKHGDFIIVIRDHVEGNDWEADGNVVVELEKNYGQRQGVSIIYDSFVIE